METASFSGPTPKIVEATSFSDHTPSFSIPAFIEGENSLHLPENSGECQTLISAMLTPKKGISDTFNPPKAYISTPYGCGKNVLDQGLSAPVFSQIGHVSPPSPCDPQMTIISIKMEEPAPLGQKPMPGVFSPSEKMCPPPPRVTQTFPMHSQKYWSQITLPKSPWLPYFPQPWKCLFHLLC
jgi:hypothetical protein